MKKKIIAMVVAMIFALSMIHTISKSESTYAMEDRRAVSHGDEKILQSFPVVEEHIDDENTENTKHMIQR